MDGWIDLWQVFVCVVMNLPRNSCFGQIVPVASPIYESFYVSVGALEAHKQDFTQKYISNQDIARRRCMYEYVCTGSIKSPHIDVRQNEQLFFCQSPALSVGHSHKEKVPQETQPDVSSEMRIRKRLC